MFEPSNIIVLAIFIEGFLISSSFSYPFIICRYFTVPVNKIQCKIYLTRLLVKVGCNFMQNNLL